MQTKSYLYSKYDDVHKERLFLRSPSAKAKYWASGCNFVFKYEASSMSLHVGSPKK